MDSLWALQRANLLPSVPSKEFLMGNSKSKKPSYIEVPLARWRIVTHLLSLSDEQFVKDRFCLASTSVQSWPIDGVELTAPSLILAEIVKDFHQGQFDPCLRTFLAECPGGRIQETKMCVLFLCYKKALFSEKVLCQSKQFAEARVESEETGNNSVKNETLRFQFPSLVTIMSISGSAQQMLNLEKIQVRMDDFNKASVAHAAPVTCAEPAAVAADIVTSAAATAIAAAPEPAAATGTKEQQIHNLCSEWRGTIWSLWRRHTIQAHTYSRHGSRQKKEHKRRHRQGRDNPNMWRQHKLIRT